MKVKSSAGVPKALREVWVWKDAVYRDTEGLTMADALRHIHQKVDAVRRTFGLKVAAPHTDAALVAEERGGYGTT